MKSRAYILNLTKYPSVMKDQYINLICNRLNKKGDLFRSPFYKDIIPIYSLEFL